MAVPQNKSELLCAIEKEFDKLSREIALVPAEYTLTKSMPGHAKGSSISPHDLVAYLVGWNELVLKWHAKMASNESVDFPETGFKWSQLGRLATKFYQDYEHLAFTDLVAQLHTAKGHLVGLIERHSDAELYGCPWYGKWTMGRMIQLNTASPYANACGRLRKWRKTQHGEKQTGNCALLPR
ncbi:ClbS/DfsB family four-helix bundle protein [Lampropedia puyangensis]|uniref:ClbS/DfsB family four-helix bundle protein n=1 Tax=Lampropedia puyangensis TaxID=1330072 RepID=A0A4S8FET9_9BURK|nr:ClbS/DfsB family four-helix bundle protein [Lampropedia puyangensis]THU05164.1 ClbS/DfsB family four-helix bundle protein [Lampropedia puyangensis]